MDPPHYTLVTRLFHDSCITRRSIPSYNSRAVVPKFLVFDSKFPANSSITLARTLKSVLFLNISNRCSDKEEISPTAFNLLFFRNLEIISKFVYKVYKLTAKRKIYTKRKPSKVNPDILTFSNLTFFG